MKRVLVLGLTSNIGGIETYLKNIVLSSDSQNIQYDFLVKGNGEAIFEKQIKAFYQNRRCFFHITKLKVNPLLCAIETKRIYKLNKYDAIYINTCTSSDILYGTLFSNNVPIIMHSHYSFDGIMISNAVFKRYASRKAYAKLACSKVAAKWLYDNCDNVEIIKNGIYTDDFKFSDIDRNSTRKQYSIGEKTLLIGNVGRLSKQKNQSFLLEILNEMLAMNKEKGISYNDIRLMICGDGEEKNRLIEYAKELGVLRSVVFTGNIDNINKIYSAMDVYVMPSLYEGLPIAGVEAQSSGLPCLFSDSMDDQISITDRAEMLPIGENNLKLWVERILSAYEAHRGEREKYAAEVKSKGYDIDVISKKVANILTRE